MATKAAQHAFTADHEIRDGRAVARWKDAALADGAERGVFAEERINAGCMVDVLAGKLANLGFTGFVVFDTNRTRQLREASILVAFRVGYDWHLIKHVIGDLQTLDTECFDVDFAIDDHVAKLAAAADLQDAHADRGEEEEGD